MNRQKFLVAIGIIATTTGCTFSSIVDDKIEAYDESTGRTIIDFRTIKSSAECPSGGVEAITGEDINDDGIIQESEVERVQSICSGEVGYDTLIRVIDDPTTAHCKLINVGKDTNENGTLDEDEIYSSTKICDGTDGADGNAGLDGVDGTDGTDGGGGVVSISEDGFIISDTVYRSIRNNRFLRPIYSFKTNSAGEVLFDYSREVLFTLRQMNDTSSTYLGNGKRKISVEADTTYHIHLEANWINRVGKSYFDANVKVTGDVTYLETFTPSREEASGLIPAGNGAFLSHRNDNYSFMFEGGQPGTSLAGVKLQIDSRIQDVSLLVRSADGGYIKRLFTTGTLYPPRGLIYITVSPPSTAKNVHYTLSVDGYNYSEFKKIPSKVTIIKGKWKNASSSTGSPNNPRYEFDNLKDDGVIDINLYAVDGSTSAMTLHNSQNIIIASRVNQDMVIGNRDEGLYTVIPRPASSTNYTGDFVMIFRCDCTVNRTPSFPD